MGELVPMTIPGAGSKTCSGTLSHKLTADVRGSAPKPTCEKLTWLCFLLGLPAPFGWFDEETPLEGLFSALKFLHYR